MLLWFQDFLSIRNLYHRKVLSYMIRISETYVDHCMAHNNKYATYNVTSVLSLLSRLLGAFEFPVGSVRRELWAPAQAPPITFSPGRDNFILLLILAIFQTRAQKVNVENDIICHKLCHGPLVWIKYGPFQIFLCLRGLHRSINILSTVTKILLTLNKIYKSLLRLHPNFPTATLCHPVVVTFRKNPCRKNVSTCSVRDENSCGKMWPGRLQRIWRGMPLHVTAAITSCPILNTKLLRWKKILRGACLASVARYVECSAHIETFCRIHIFIAFYIFSLQQSL